MPQWTRATDQLSSVQPRPRLSAGTGAEDDNRAALCHAASPSRVSRAYLNLPLSLSDTPIRQPRVLYGLEIRVRIQLAVNVLSVQLIFTGIAFAVDAHGARIDLLGVALRAVHAVSLRVVLGIDC
jgi:hypothetical protein